MKSLANAAMTAPKAVPRTTATARSMTLPRSRKSLNPLITCASRRRSTVAGAHAVRAWVALSPAAQHDGQPVGDRRAGQPRGRGRRRSRAGPGHRRRRSRSADSATRGTVTTRTAEASRRAGDGKGDPSPASGCPAPRTSTTSPGRRRRDRLRVGDAHRHLHEAGRCVLDGGAAPASRTSVMRLAAAGAGHQRAAERPLPVGERRRRGRRPAGSGRSRGRRAAGGCRPVRRARR